MTQAVYIIGGAGTGKSTVTQALLDLLDRPLGPLEDLYSKANSRGTVITLRGHQMGEDGLYLGCMRDSFPGTDGLIHIRHMAEGRVERVTDVEKEGDEVHAKCIDIDPSGRSRLSRKEALADALASQPQASQES